MSDLEKLERLEQSITQLLYEIDANFSKCHRIITNNILPIIEKYAENSGQVWEHSKFWKQFFEASANVSLSGYEEQANQDASELTQVTRDGEEEDSNQGADSTTQSPYHKKQQGTGESPFDLTRDDEMSSVIRRPRLQSQTPVHRQMESLEISSSPGDPPTPQTVLRSEKYSHRNSDTPLSSPMYHPEHNQLHGTPRTAPRARNKNPLLHRVLDSNWKVQATPHSVHSRYARAEVSNDSTSPTSSPPEMTTRLDTSRHSKSRHTPSGPRGALYDSDDESSIGQMSPPVTMAFSLPPSKLLRTPAKEAARHMVDEILRTAGANDLSTVPSETPLEPPGRRYQSNGETGLSQSTFIQGSQNEPRRLFGHTNDREDTPIGRKTTGVLDQWQESEEGSNWL